MTTYDNYSYQNGQEKVNTLPLGIIRNELVSDSFSKADEFGRLFAESFKPVNSILLITIVKIKCNAYF